MLQVCPGSLKCQADPRSILGTCPFPSSLPAQLPKRVVSARGQQAPLARTAEGGEADRDLSAKCGLSREQRGVL